MHSRNSKSEAVAPTMTGMKRLLIVGNFLSRHQRSRGVCEDLAERLQANGWQVTTTSHYLGRARRLADMLITVILRRADYDVAQVDVFSGPAFRWAELVTKTLRWLKKPFVLTLHGGNLPTFAAEHPRRIKAIFRSASAITTPSVYLQRELVNYYPNLICLPYAIDLRNYTFRLRQSVQPRLLWLRSFGEIYNPSLAVRVLAHLRQVVPAATLMMIGHDLGDGTLEKTRTLAKVLGVETAVTFHGSVPKSEIGSWMQQYDIYLHTNHVDNTPVTVIEAMVCGLCIVCTDVGGIPDLVTHERDGLIVPDDDEQAMTDMVLRILREPELASRLSQGGYATATAYDWPDVLSRWENLLKDTAHY